MRERDVDEETLAARVAQFGVKVTPGSLRNIAAGKEAGYDLVHAIAAATGLSPVEIRPPALTAPAEEAPVVPAKASSQ